MALRKTGASPPKKSLTGSFFIFLPTKYVTNPAISVIIVPKIVSSGAQPLIRFTIKHPAVTPQTASPIKSGKSVNASAIRTCTIPLASGKFKKESPTYKLAIIPALAICSVFVFFIKKSLFGFPKKDL